MTTGVPARSSGSRYFWSVPVPETIRPSTRRAAKAATSAFSLAGSSSVLAERTTTPRRSATSSTARCIAAQNGLSTLAKMRPTLPDRRTERRKFPALRSGRKCSSAAALVTRLTNASETPGSPLTTRETVLMPTPARAATSCIVARRVALEPGADDVVVML